MSDYVIHKEFQYLWLSSGDGRVQRTRAPAAGLKQTTPAELRCHCLRFYDVLCDFSGHVLSLGHN
jgi:hypothetical protein